MNDLKNILLEGEEVHWEGRPVRLPRGILFGGGAFLLLFTFFMVWPLAYSLATGDRSHFENFSYTINGHRITDDTADSVLKTGLWISVFTIIPVFLFIFGWTYQKMRECYAVTGRRLVILSRFPRRRIVSLDPTCMPIMERSGGQKVGSLAFNGAETGIMDKILTLYRIKLVEFSNIQNPGDVEKLIANTFQNNERKSEQ